MTAKPPKREKYSKGSVRFRFRRHRQTFLFRPTFDCLPEEDFRQVQEFKMKKLIVILPLALVLLSLTIGIAGAGYGYADPALCVAGKWLVVNAAKDSAVTVFVPEDSKYGNQIQGGCTTPGPNVPIIQTVKEKGEHRLMVVQIDGKNASTPSVSVTYGNRPKVQNNNGRGKLNFLFMIFGPDN
jgi:hypothetical protein